jgi:hypothetical protein
MKTAAVFAGIMLCAAGQLVAAPATNNTAERIVRWQEDLDCFALELPARHKDFYQLMPRDRFEREVAELKREVPQLSDAEVILRLSRMVASLGVAHTSIDITSIPGTMAFHSYPVQMQWFSDELAVVAAAPEYQAMLGSRVVRIGSKTPREVEAAAAPYIASENNAHLHYISPRYMRLVEVMQKEKIADRDGHLQLTCAKAGGAEFTVDIAPMQSARTGRKWVNAAAALRIPEGLCHKHPGAFYWYEYLPEKRILYIQYSKCTNEPGNPFTHFASNLFAFADAHPGQRVIIDLRFNGGGSSGVVNPLMAGLHLRPALTAKEHLYVLTA